MKPVAFTPPITPSGHAQVVPGPPWYFYGHNIHLDFEVSPEAAAGFLPPGVSLDPEHPGQVQLAFSDMCSYATHHLHQDFIVPGDVQFKETLLKIKGIFEGNAYWFVALTWVTSDVSMLRGYLQGFPKRLGEVEMSRFESFHPKVPGRSAGATQYARLAAPNGLIIHGSHEPREPASGDIMDPAPFLLRRHISDLAHPDRMLGDALVCPRVSYSENSEVMIGKGNMQIGSMDAELESILTPSGDIRSKSFVSACTIEGTDVLKDLMED